MKKYSRLKIIFFSLLLLTFSSYGIFSQSIQKKVFGFNPDPLQNMANAVLEASDCSLAISFINNKVGPISFGDPAYTMYSMDSGDYDIGSDNREFAFAPQTISDGISTLQLVRKVYIPTDDALCRWLNIFTNTGHSAVTFNVIISTNGNFEPGAIITTSHGNPEIKTTDTWVTTMPAFHTGSFASYFSYVLQTPDSPVPVSATHFTQDNANWAYTVTLQPGQTGVIMNLTTGEFAGEAPGARAVKLVQNFIPALKYMSPLEIKNLLNFCPPYQVEVISNGHGHTDQDGWHFFLPDTEFTITAFPDSGYRFHKWTGYVWSFDNPLTVIVNAHMTICANFVNDPPKITITTPANCATVKGTVNVEAKAADDSGIAKVDFIIDGITKATVTATPYQYSWNTIPYACGKYSIKAVAYDTLGLTGSDEISVNIQNITLTITGSRILEKTWLCPKKQVGNLEIRIDNPYNIPFAKLVIQRKVKGEKFQTVKEIAGSDIKGYEYHYRDGTIENDKTYVYQAIVYDASGKIIGVSNEKCI